MSTSTSHPDLSGRRVVVPGGTGAVGEGVVRAYLAAGADVVVPTRSQERADEFRHVLGDAAGDRLHLVAHDYTTFPGAAQLADEMERRLGGVDDVVAPIGGWWAGKPLWEIDENDWQSAFVGLASTHMAVLRAFLPKLSTHGTYTLIVGASALTPVPGSGLVSMEQAALLMMRRVAEAELTGPRRVHALILGPVSTRVTGTEAPDWVSADQVGAIAVAAAASEARSQEFRLGNRAEADQALAHLQAGQPARTGTVVTVSTMEPKDGRREDLVALLAELAPRIRAEPGCLRYTVHRTHGEADGPLLVIQEFTSIEGFREHSKTVAGQIPRLAALLAKPPAPPALFEPVLQ
ncbi:SDR family NAD(P)-dependent oxidoreductase [Amycolatopsis sp. SID8362]|uniref:SDR family NAD(P)-dependent oxidoreductase n=1 Tax=Amycolatopsis sp. SID8362 TaxID=2690346 RepID=UPI00136A7B77|nr:SDR family NAD(P)-dependent oxidoreductase [Amycolatopsis sp. SID8362]NBH06532.1 SDR family oxidoreductase [Amycolatopsis sp. SID8362]NED43229.1 SDR family oxidoreductase [Amycolatopsis sp. SID8362]